MSQQDHSCPQCGDNALKSCEVEIRKVDTPTNKIVSAQKFTEWECGECGWIGALDAPTGLGNLRPEIPDIATET